MCEHAKITKLEIVGGFSSEGGFKYLFCHQAHMCILGALRNPMLIMVSTKFRTSPNESITSIWAIWPELRKSLFNNLKSSKTKMCNNIIGFQFPLGSGALKELLLNTLYHFVKIIKLHIVFHWLPSVYSENKNFQFYKHPLDISKKKYQLARWMMLLCLRVSCVCRISERVEITDTAEVILT